MGQNYNNVWEMPPTSEICETVPTVEELWNVDNDGPMVKFIKIMPDMDIKIKTTWKYKHSSDQEKNSQNRGY